MRYKRNRKKVESWNKMNASGEQPKPKQVKSQQAMRYKRNRKKAQAWNNMYASMPLLSSGYIQKIQDIVNNDYTNNSPVDSKNVSNSFQKDNEKR